MARRTYKDGIKSPGTRFKVKGNEVLRKDLSRMVVSDSGEASDTLGSEYARPGRPFENLERRGAIPTSGGIAKGRQFSPFDPGATNSDGEWTQGKEVTDDEGNKFREVRVGMGNAPRTSASGGVGQTVSAQARAAESGNTRRMGRASGSRKTGAFEEEKALTGSPYVAPSTPQLESLEKRRIAPGVKLLTDVPSTVSDLIPEGGVHFESQLTDTEYGVALAKAQAAAKKAGQAPPKKISRDRAPIFRSKADLVAMLQHERADEYENLENISSNVLGTDTRFDELGSTEFRGANTQLPQIGTTTSVGREDAVEAAAADNREGGKRRGESSDAVKALTDDMQKRVRKAHPFADLISGVLPGPRAEPPDVRKVGGGDDVPIPRPLTASQAASVPTAEGIARAARSRQFIDAFAERIDSPEFKEREQLRKDEAAAPRAANGTGYVPKGPRAPAPKKEPAPAPPPFDHTQAIEDMAQALRNDNIDPQHLHKLIGRPDPTAIAKMHDAFKTDDDTWRQIVAYTQEQTERDKDRATTRPGAIGVESVADAKAREAREASTGKSAKEEFARREAIRNEAARRAKIERDRKPRNPNQGRQFDQ
jgi:hypothetical protein